MTKQNFNSQSKIIVVGTSGAGKSTLARALARKYQLKDIELDALFWKENWQPSTEDEFRHKITQALSEAQGYVIHGNYNKVRDLTWNHCDTLIWLDYSRPRVMWRVLKRSVYRIVTREKLWAENQESFRKTFLSKDSILWWSFSTYRPRFEQYQKLMDSSEYPHLNKIRVRHPSEIKDFFR